MVRIRNPAKDAIRGGIIITVNGGSGPAEGEQLTLTLPEGLSLPRGELTTAVPPVPQGAARQDSPVTWKVRADKAGEYEIVVKSSKGAVVRQKVTIRSQGLFD